MQLSLRSSQRVQISKTVERVGTRPLSGRATSIAGFKRALYAAGSFRIFHERARLDERIQPVFLYGDGYAGSQKCSVGNTRACGAAKNVCKKTSVTLW
jgi:hypothetical protein